jgi:hypothetical protein
METSDRAQAMRRVTGRETGGETGGVTGAVTAGALRSMRCYDAASAAFGSLAGVINAAHGELVDLTVLTLAEGHHVGPGLHTPAQYVAWQTGVSKATANRLVRIARRVDELPHLVGALRAGAISLDQADVVAQHCPARYDRSVTELAKTATVEQLRTVVAAYRDRPDNDDDAAEGQPEFGVSISRDRRGATVRARMSNGQADLFETALEAMREDLYRQRCRDARRAAEETGGQPAAVPAPTGVEALVAVAETSLRVGEAALPGAERYLISYHLHASADGHRALTDDRGRLVGDSERRRLLCDCAGEAIFHDHSGAPLSVGRKTRTVGPKLRRAILFRHRHRCAVPGCDVSHGLEVHHIRHWEDGGLTDTGNLIALCHHHHKVHHQGLLGIAGNADLPDGSPGAVAFTASDCQPLPQPAGPPGRQHPQRPGTARIVHRLSHELERRSLHRNRRRVHSQHPNPTASHRSGDPGPTASTPTGERLQRWAIHLQADAPDPPLRT